MPTGVGRVRQRSGLPPDSSRVTAPSSPGDRLARRGRVFGRRCGRFPAIIGDARARLRSAPAGRTLAQRASSSRASPFRRSNRPPRCPTPGWRCAALARIWPSTGRAPAGAAQLTQGDQIALAKNFARRRARPLGRYTCRQPQPLQEIVRRQSTQPHFVLCGQNTVSGTVSRTATPVTRATIIVQGCPGAGHSLPFAAHINAGGQRLTPTSMPALGD